MHHNMSEISLRSLEDIIKFESIPLCERTDARTTYDILQTAAKQHPDRTALIFLPFGPFGNMLDDPQKAPIKSIYTYQELLERVNQTANLLLELGVKEGDVVSYLLPNVAENYFLLLAAQTVGIANPINPMFTPTQIATLLQTAGSKILVAGGPAINPAWSQVEEVRKLYPNIETLLIVGGKEDNFHARLEKQSKEFTPRNIQPESICSYFHTSSTTFEPKLAQHSQWGNIQMALVSGIYAKYTRPNTVILSGLPMFHVGAPMLCGIAAFMYGATVVVMSPMGWRDAQTTANFWKLVEKYQGTSVVASPIIYSTLLQTPVAGADITSLRSIISGKAVTRQTFLAFEALTGIQIDTLWGQTEITALGTFNVGVSPDNKHFGTMGFRVPYQQTKIVKLDKHGRYIGDCEVDEAGVLLVKGPNVVGYKDPALSKTAVLSLNDEKWHVTGDVVSQALDGCLTIIGRINDFIYRNGEQIPLLATERMLCEHPLVLDAAIVNIPQKDAELDEQLVAYVELKQPAAITPEELMTWLRGKLAEKFRPDRIIICQVGEIPRNAMSKPLKYKLRVKYSESVV